MPAAGPDIVASAAIVGDQVMQESGGDEAAATSLGIAVGNTLEGLIGAYLVNRFAHGRDAFERPQDIVRFAVLAGLASTTTYGGVSLRGGDRGRAR